MKGVLTLVLIFGFWGMGFVQMFATYDFFRFYWHWGWVGSALATGAVAYIPLLGSVSGLYGAIYVWDWPWWQAGVLFFWWPCLMFVLYVGGSCYDLFDSLKDKFSKKRTDPVMDAFHELSTWINLRDFPKEFNKIETLIKNRKSQIAYDRGRALLPHEMAFWSIVNILADEVAYGGHYVYRGVLSMHGKNLFAAHNKLALKAVQEDIIEQSTAEEICQAVREAVAQNG